MAMYIDTISDSLRNAQSVAQGLQDMKKSAIAQRLQSAQLLRDMGENLEAEKMLHSAKNYGLSSLFAPKAEEWVAQGAFRNADIPLQQEQFNLDAEKGRMIAQFLDPKSPNYNPDMAKTIANADAQGTTLRSLSDLNKVQEQGMINFTPKSIQEQYKPQLQAYTENEKVNAPVREYNKKAEAYNKVRINIKNHILVMK
jgi:hypothetical protein